MTFRDRHHTVRLSIRTMPLADPEAVERLQARIAAAAAAQQPAADIAEAAITQRDARFRAAIHFALAQPVPHFLRRQRR